MRSCFLLNASWIIALTIQSNVVSSQGTDWYQFDVDSIVSIQFPTNQVYVIDTIINRVHLYQLRADIDNATYIIQRSEIRDDSEDENSLVLPYDDNSLSKYYDGVSSGLLKNTKYVKKVEAKITNSGYIGRKVILKNDSGKVGTTTTMYLLDEHLYHLFYINDNRWNEEIRDSFLNSITINSSRSISQFIGTPPEERKTYFIGQIISYGLIALLAFFLIWKGIIKPRVKKTD